MQQEPATPQSRPIVPGHPRWIEFLERLAGPATYNFQNERRICLGDMRVTTSILRDMGLDESSIEVSTAFFRRRGAYCDCEVVFNVDPTQ
jgi:hypothetical protein